MKQRRPYTAKEYDTVRRLYANNSSAEIAEIIGRSVSSVYNMARKLGVKKSKEWIAERARIRSLDPNHGGRMHQFRRGQPPHNKGLKQSEFMSPQAIERSRTTRFKKGNQPHNTRPVGALRLDSDGYTLVKTAEPSTWELKHRIVWREHHGDIPEGHNIQFKDGNRQNFCIENLYIISRTDQMANENNINRYPKEVTTAIRAVAKLEKTIRKQLKDE